MRRGYVVISCGWQIDLPEVPGLLGLRGPEALDAAGNRLTGRVYTQLQTPAPAPHLLLSDRGHRPYPAADLDERDAILHRARPARRRRDDDRARRWRFARVGRRRGRTRRPLHPARRRLREGPPVPGDLYGRGRADRRTRHRRAPRLRRLAQARDRARRQPRAGRSAVRVRVWPLADRTAAADARLHDLNVDEHGRDALDGIIANVAGGLRGEFNQRFGQNSKDRPHMMDYVQPATDGGSAPAARGARKHAEASSTRTARPSTTAATPRSPTRTPRARATSRPARRRASITLPGTEHGLGVWPPTSEKIAAADPSEPSEHSQNLRNTIDYAPLLRACLVNLDRWVTDRRRAAAEPSSAARRRQRGAVRGAPRGVRPDPRRPLSAPSRAPVPPRLLRRCRRGRARRAARSSPPSTPTATRPAASRCRRSRCRSAPTPDGRCAMRRSAVRPSAWSSPGRRFRSPSTRASAKPRATRGPRSRSATDRGTTTWSACGAPPLPWRPSATSSTRTST